MLIVGNPQHNFCSLSLVLVSRDVASTAAGSTATSLLTANMSPYGDGREYGEENFIAGAHGTISEQQDEAFYNDRSDASDDMEKGRLKRDRELEILCKLYDGLSSDTHRARGSTNNSNSEMDKIATAVEEDDEEFKSIPDPFFGSQVVFLSGYSGIGKSALVSEFIKQTQSQYGSSQKSSQILQLRMNCTRKF